MSLVNNFTQKETEALRDEYHMPSHIRLHCDQVAIVAVFVAQKLIEQGKILNLGDIMAGAKLHDLLRVCDLKNWPPESMKKGANYGENLKTWEEIRKKYSGLTHWEAGYLLLKDRGLPHLAEIVRRHNLLNILDKDLAPRTLEEKIVFYADKRVAHTKIVTLTERFTEGAGRHPGTPPAMQKKLNLAIAKTRTLERELLAAANLKSFQIPDQHLG